MSDESETEQEAPKGEFTIDRIELRTGWVCFQAGQSPPPLDQLPAHLNQCMCDWLQRNENFKVISVVPITERGNTVAIHVWFE